MVRSIVAVVAVCLCLSLYTASVSAASFEITPNPFNNVIVGTYHVFTITASATYPNVSVEFLSSENYDITPNILNFTDIEGVLSKNITYYAKKNAYITVTTQLDGDFATQYNALTFSHSSLIRTLSFAGGYATHPVDEPILRVPTNPFNIFLSYFPVEGVTVTASAYPAESLTFSVATFAFTGVEKHYVFSYEALTTGDENGEITLAYTFSGAAAHFYQPQNFTLWPSKRTIVPASSYTNVAAVKVSEKSQAISLSVNYKPPTDFTLSPHSEKLSFDPISLSFTNEVDTQQFAFTASAPGAHVIYWTLSGTDAALYYDFPNKTIFVGARPFVITPPGKTSFAVGESSEWTISTQYPPTNDLTVTFLLADSVCTLGTPTVTPPFVTFTPTVTELTFKVSAPVLCSSVELTAEVSGLQKDDYGVPDFSPYGLAFGKLDVTWDNADPAFSTLRCGDTTQYILAVTTPPPSGFDVALSGPGATFDPKSVSFTPTMTKATISVTANYIQNPIIVHFTVSGTDVPLLNNIQDKQISVAAKTVTTKAGSTFVTPGASSLYAGTISQQVYVDLSHLPAHSVKVTPAANGLVFDPVELAFDPQHDSLPFTVTAAEPGTYTVTYTLSGNDAGCYSLSMLTTSVTVRKVSVEISDTLGDLETGLWSPYYTLSIEHFSGEVTLTAVAYDLNKAVVATYEFEPAVVTLSGSSPTATFRYRVSEYRPISDYVVFEVKDSDDANIVNNLILDVGASERRSFVTPARLLNYQNGNYQPARFVQGVASPDLVVKVAQPPPSGVDLRPYAPNTVFNPELISFTSDITSVSFTVTSTDGSVGGIVKPITWTVEGANKDLYNTPGANGYIALKRTLKVSAKSALTGSSVYVNTPLPFTVVTQYPPSSTLTITPVGEHYSFNPTSVTIAADATASDVLIVTPTVGDVDAPIKFVVTGQDADAYETLADTYIYTKKTGFLISTPSSSSGSVKLVYGATAYALNIRPRTPPPTSVTLKIFSQQVTIQPADITFTPTITSHDLYVSPLFAAFPNGLTPSVSLEFVVEGADAMLYDTPNDVTFDASIDSPLRTLVVNPSTIRLSIGKPTSFFVSSTIPPVSSVTITPTTPTDTDFEFSPVSAEITPDAPSAKFTVMRKSTALPRQSSTQVAFGISGADAHLYSDPTTASITAQSGAITMNLDSTGTVNLIVNQALSVSVSLTQVPTAELIIKPTVVVGQHIVFDPEEIKFAAGQVATVFKLTAQGAGTSRVAFRLEGDAASSFAFEDDVDFSISTGTITFSTPWSFTVGGQKKTGYISLNTPSLNGLEITPSATGLTFEPETIAFAAGQVTAPYSVTVSNSAISAYLTTVLGGPDGDAGLFANPYPNPTTTFSVGTPFVTAAATSNANTFLKQTVTFTLGSAASVVPLRIKPSGDGLTFVPEVAEIFDTTTTSVKVDVFSSEPGRFNIFYELEGEGAVHFSVPNLFSNQIISTFYAYPIEVITPVDDDGYAVAGTVGITSPAFTIKLPTLVSSVEPISITPKTNLAGFDIIPSVIILNSTITTATFYVRSNITVGTVVISFEVSGTGAGSFILPVTPVSYVIGQGNFRVPIYDNKYAFPTAVNTFIYGVGSQAYILSARSVPVDVDVELVSDHLVFSPPVLKFTPRTHDVLFSFVPKKIGTATITYRVLGPNARLFAAPGPDTVIVTYDVKFPQIPTLAVGIPSPVQGVTVNPAPESTFVLNLAIGSNFVFNPARLVFAPGQTQNSFTVTALAPTIARPVTYHIPGVAPPISNGAAVISVTGTDSSDDTARSIPLSAYVPVIAAPGYFTILHPRYQLDVKTSIKVSISVEPRSDVILTLLGNNLQFHTPQFLVFTRGGPTEQEIEVTPRHTTSYELDYASFKVDYYVSGTHSADYIAPSETLHYIAIPMGYIAAIVLVPLAVVVIVIIVIVVLKKVGGGKSGGSFTKSVSVN